MSILFILGHKKIYCIPWIIHFSRIACVDQVKALFARLKSERLDFVFYQTGEKYASRRSGRMNSYHFWVIQHLRR